MPSTATIGIFVAFMAGVLLVAVALPWLGHRQDSATADADDDEAT